MKKIISAFLVLTMLFSMSTTAFAKSTKQLKENAAKLEGKTFEMSVKGGDSGKLFGSITAKEIAEFINTKTGIVIDKKKVETDTIKTFGAYPVTVKLYKGISAKITVNVVKGN